MVVSHVFEVAHAMPEVAKRERARFVADVDNVSSHLAWPHMWQSMNVLYLLSKNGVIKITEKNVWISNETSGEWHTYHVAGTHADCWRITGTRRLCSSVRCCMENKTIVTILSKNKNKRG